MMIQRTPSATIEHLQHAALLGRQASEHTEQPAPAPAMPEPQREASSFSLSELIALLSGASGSQQLAAVTELRKRLSATNDPPFQRAIDAGAVPPLMALLRAQWDSQPALQFEAAWALTNVASGTSAHTASVVAAGAVPAFVRLLSSHSNDVREQAVWALGNIAGDTTSTRDSVLAAGTLAPLLGILEDNLCPLLMQRNATWALSNLCRAKPRPRFATLAPALPVLAQLIHSPDSEVVTDACWALSYLSDGDDENICAVQTSGVLGRLLQLMADDDSKALAPALRVVGNCVSGGEARTQCAIDAGALSALARLLGHAKANMRKEACWALSNVAAGTAAQVHQVLRAGLAPAIVRLASTDELAVRQEALWTITNACANAPTQRGELVQEGCLRPLICALECPEPTSAWYRVVAEVLGALEKLLDANLLQGQVAYVIALGVRSKLAALRALPTLPRSARDGADALLRRCDAAARRQNGERDSVPVGAG